MNDDEGVVRLKPERAVRLKPERAVRLKPDTTLMVIEMAAIEAIRRHGVATFPEECCGALIGRDGVITDAFPMDNTTTSGAARRFRIGPDAYRRAEARASDRGASLMGFYHSHPNAPARPSAYDLEHAWPNFIYVIISVTNGEPGDVTAWWLRDNRSGFDEGELRWHTGS